MNDTSNTYIRFDWAMKRLLRNKANFDVLEGFLTSLLEEQIKIDRLLESESNVESESDKLNRVDLLAENSKGELIIIEIQNNNEFAYFQRMLFGTSKLVTEYINRGQGYDKIRKIYSVNIVYFALGSGKDVVYHGKTVFKGMRFGDILELSPFQKQKFHVSEVSELYPEYYILKVNNFDDVAKTPLDEWIAYLKSGDISAEATAPGLDKVRERMKLDTMSRKELNQYYKHLDNIVILQDNIYTERAEGRAEGLAEGKAIGIEKGKAIGIEKGKAIGIEEGIAQEKRSNAKKMKDAGLPTKTISEITGLTTQEIEEL